MKKIFLLSLFLLLAGCTVEVEDIIFEQNEYILLVGEAVDFDANVFPTDATDSSLIIESSNQNIASVRNGKITGISKGTTVISAVASNGLSRSVSVTVGEAVRSIGLTLTETVIDIGETIQINVSFSPSDSLYKELTWRSSNTDVVMVDNRGMITGLSPGTAQVIATAHNGVNEAVTILVKQAVTSIQLVASKTTINVTEELALSATILPQNAFDSSVAWRSSNPNILNVNDTGVVRGLSPGTATIFVAATNGIEANITITVFQPVTSVDLVAPKSTIDVSETMTIVANVLPTNASEKSITWSSSNPNVLTVDTNGVVRGVSPGTADVKVTTQNGIEKTIRLTIVQPVSSIDLSASKTTINVDETATIFTIIRPINASNTNLTWSSSNPGIVSVSADGVVRGIATGTATVTASSTNGISQTITINVVQLNPTSISMNRSQVGLEINESLQLQATMLPSNAIGALTWSSSDSSIATVSSNGEVTALSEGVATITVRTINGLQATTRIYVRYGIGDYIVNEVEPNGTIGLADLIPRNGSIFRGSNASKQDLDVFRVSLPANVTFTLIFTSNFNVDLQYFLIGLYDQNENLITVALPSSSGTTKFFDQTITSSGNYYIYVLYSSESPYTTGDSYTGYVYWQ